MSASAPRFRVHPSTGERAQSTPLVAILLVTAALLVVAVARLGGVTIDRASAQSAADAAALAGGMGGEAEARSIAEANGGVLVAYQRSGRVVEVTVVVGQRQAVARVEVTTTPGSGSRAGLDPRLLAALARADAALGVSVPVVSGLRTRAQQVALWESRFDNPYPVARPGTSMHESGRAVDVARTFVSRLVPVARSVGLCQPLPDTDPVHFILC